MFHLEDDSVLDEAGFKDYLKAFSHDEKSSLIVVHVDLSLSALCLSLEIDNALAWSTRDLLEMYDFLFREDDGQNSQSATAEGSQHR